MPIILEKDLPEYKIFTGDGMFVMDNERAQSQQIRPLEIAILNLTPDGGSTETRLMRLLSNSPLQVNVTLLNISSYNQSNTGINLSGFYRTFTEIETKKFDGMIIAGTPSENLPFKKAAYWKELVDIMEWTKSNVTSTMFVCWGALAALHHFYGIKKHSLKDKCLGIFSHRRIRDGVPEPLMRGISDEFDMPHCGYNIICAKDVMHVNQLKILAYSKRAGASVIKSADNRRVFVTGHMEYDRYALKNEYERDKAGGLSVKPPVNYFTDKEMLDVKMNWTSTANLFYINWLNYYVYQVTPYNIDAIEAKI